MLCIFYSTSRRAFGSLEMNQLTQDRKRFLLDLEFVNALASPLYLQRAHLAPNNVYKSVHQRKMPAVSPALFLVPMRKSVGHRLSHSFLTVSPLVDLAQARYLEDEAFIGYLTYLQYWHEPQYSKYIM